MKLLLVYVVLKHVYLMCRYKNTGVGKHAKHFDKFQLLFSLLLNEPEDNVLRSISYSKWFTSVLLVLYFLVLKIVYYLFVSSSSPYWVSVCWKWLMKLFLDYIMDCVWYMSGMILSFIHISCSQALFRRWCRVDFVFLIGVYCEYI